jgi:DNA-binding transcriptional LysR family regulator
MELRHLRYFCAVAEELHFGRAAERLHIAQPPLSIQIRNLEQEIGVPLLLRKRNVELTPAGREFLEYARIALNEVQQGIRSAQRVHLGERGRLNIGFISSMAYTYMPTLIGEFRKRFPDVELVLNYLDTWSQFAAIREGRINVGVVRGPVNESGLTSVTVLTEALVVAMPTSHRLVNMRKVPLSALAKDSFIRFPRAMYSPPNNEISRLFQRAGFTPHVSQEEIQLHVVVGLVSAGIGVALVPESTQLLPVPNVVYRPLLEGDGHVHVAVVFRTKDASTVVGEFVNVARHLFSRRLRGRKRPQNASASGRKN